MSKFSKRSIAVLTTAAIMASSMSIVAYAASVANVTISWDTESGLIESVKAGSAAFTSGTKKASISSETITVTTTSEKVVVTGAAGITQDADNKTVWTFTAKANTEYTLKASEQTEGAKGIDGTLWVGGKDVKANESKGIEAEWWKSEPYQYVNLTAGGKLQAVVIDAETIEKVLEAKEDYTEVDAFFSVFGKDLNKAKFDKTAASTKAKAKIKDGEVTVSATGKGVGDVYVFVYEVANKKVVGSTSEKATNDLLLNAKVDLSDISPEASGEVYVQPKSEMFFIAAAATTVTFTNPGLDENGNVPAVDKPTKLDSKATFMGGDETVVYFCDKKNATSVDNTFSVVDPTDKKKTLEAKPATEAQEYGLEEGTEYYEAENCAVVFVDAVPAGEVDGKATDAVAPSAKIIVKDGISRSDKITVSIKNNESGKISSIKLKPAETVEVTLKDYDADKGDIVKEGDKELIPTNNKIVVRKGAKITFVAGDGRTAKNGEDALSSTTAVEIKSAITVTFADVPASA